MQACYCFNQHPSDNSYLSKSFCICLTVQCSVVIIKIDATDLGRISINYEVAKRDIIKSIQHGMSLQNAAKLYLDVLKIEKIQRSLWRISSKKEENKMKATDVADFFISLGNAENEDPMTNMRINKLMYFAQGWHLQRFGKPLFSEPIKAWKYGPVIESIYGKYHSYGRNIITESSPKFNISSFSAEDIQLILDVYNKYRGLSTSRLVEKSHEENTPWAKIYEEGKNKTIPNSLIKEYFSNHTPPKPLAVPTGIEFTGRINPKTGRTILPADEDEGDEAYEDLV